MVSSQEMQEGGECSKMSARNIDNKDELGLSDRGIGVQAAGFAVVGCAIVAVLHLFSDSDYLLYQWFETAVTRLYWAFVVPLAALFDWGRIMFAKGKAIREAKKREILAKVTQQGIEQGIMQGIEQGIMQERKRSNAKWRALAEKYGIPESELPFTDKDV
jgi:hypothetical protein